MEQHGWVMEEQGRGNGRWAMKEEGWVMEEEGREGGRRPDRERVESPPRRSISHHCHRPPRPRLVICFSACPHRWRSNSIQTRTRPPALTKLSKVRLSPPARSPTRPSIHARTHPPSHARTHPRTHAPPSHARTHPPAVPRARTHPPARPPSPARARTHPPAFARARPHIHPR